MHGNRLALASFLLVCVFVGAQRTRTHFHPLNCTLQCVHQGTPGCEYCRISKDDVQSTLGFSSVGLFGGCVPWPCYYFLGKQTPEVCQHYVHAPENVTIEFVDNPNPKFDTAVVSWSPSQYGIAFLQGFQVTMQTLGGTKTYCQLFLLQNNLSLSATHGQRVYYSDHFPGLSLGTQYAVTVMAIPVPELWEKFYNSKLFFTRTCPEKNGLEHCKSDWYPRYIEVHQDSQDIVVTFNLAPENLGISRYFSVCFGGGLRRYKNIQPDLSVNDTHHTYRLLNLHKGTNYTCEIAADIVDAVRKTFFVQIQHYPKGPSALHNKGPPLAVILFLSILMTASLTAIFIILCQKKRLRKKAVKKEIRQDIIEKYYDKHLDEPHRVTLNTSNRPPQLLICYSSIDGPVHVKVVLQLATFLQKHMATQVHLDLWDALSIMEEGDLGWYCRMIKESDFVMVICSRGLNQKQQRQRTVEEHDSVENTLLTITAIIGEEMCRAKAHHQDLSKYMTAIFEYSKESDIPAILNLALNYTLPKDLPLLFSHLHRLALQKPGAYLRVENISENKYSKLPAGSALFLAIEEAKSLIAA
ncbi:interleukin-17 receptor D [Salminus brasiliensis]|uniref:interleukin-17 receptor D n=1 Tax=Salminus brasiliensis TaxID=930266 RepID=UPI003B82D6DD